MKTREERIKELREQVQKKQDAVNKAKAALEIEEAKAKEEYLKRINEICKKSELDIESCCTILEKVAASKMSVEDVEIMLDEFKPTAKENDSEK